MEYLHFLWYRGETNNVRSVFERVLATVPKPAVQQLWLLFLQFEADAGDLISLGKLEVLCA